MACTEYPDIPFADIDESPTAMEYGCSLIVSCKPGYMFTEGVVQQTVICNKDGGWAMNYTSCDRMLVQLFNIYINSHSYTVTMVVTSDRVK